MQKTHKRRIVITAEQMIIAFAILAIIGCVGGIILGFHFRDVDVIRVMTVMLIMNVTFLSSYIVLFKKPIEKKPSALAIEA